MRIDILSLFPGYFKGPFDESIIAKARERGILDIRLVDMRTFADNRYRRVDDRPYGGGPGMVLMPQPVVSAIRHVKADVQAGNPVPDSHLSGHSSSRVIYLSPQGVRLTAAKCRELSHSDHLILLCGHYEGVDERALEAEVDEEISIGDYVLTNGCLAAIVLVDALVRFVPGVLGHESAADEDSFERGILDCPHYTRPELFEGRQVPKVLLSGNHKQIAKWREAKALEKTKQRRPDL